MLGEAAQPLAGAETGRRILEPPKQAHGMSMLNTLKLAWQGVMLNKLRSVLTTLGIIIGVAAVIIMLAVSAGAETAIADQIATLGANLVMVTPAREFGGVRGAGGGFPGGGGFFFGGGGPPGGGPGGAPGAQNSQNPALYYDDAIAIGQQVDGVAGVSVEQRTSQQVRTQGSTLTGPTTMTGVNILGVTPDYTTVRGYGMGDGRFVSADDNNNARKVAVLGAGVAKDLFGDQSPIGQALTIGSSRFTVIGVMAPQGTVAGQDVDGRVYIPVTVVFKSFSRNRLADPQVGVVYVKTANKDVMTSVIDQINQLLATRHNVDPSRPNFSVTTQQDLVNARASTTATFRNLLAWVAAVSLLVGGIGIMNIMLVSVTERTREIGISMALGARGADIRRQFLFEALMLSLVGGLVGVICGIAGAYLLDTFGGMKTTLVPTSLPLAFGAAAAVGIFFGYYPATQAAKLDPIEALRRE